MATSASRAIAALYMNERCSDVELRLIAANGAKKTLLESICAHSLPLKLRSTRFFKLILPNSFSLLTAKSRYCVELDMALCAGGVETFRHVLKFIYTDSIEFLGRNAKSESPDECFDAALEQLMCLLSAAGHYGVEALTAHCVRHLEETLLSSGNALYVLSLLRRRRHPNGEESLEKAITACLCFIDAHAPAVINSAAFRSIDRALLVELLARGSMDASETLLFDAAVGWAKHQCLRQGLAPTGPNMRSVLGHETLYQVRFALMSLREFEERVVPFGLLSDAEKHAIRCAIVAPATDQNCDPRRVAFPWCKLCRLPSRRAVWHPVSMATALAVLYHSGAAYADLFIRPTDITAPAKKRPIGAIYAHSLVLRLLSPLFDAKLDFKAASRVPILADSSACVQLYVGTVGNKSKPPSFNSLADEAMDVLLLQGLLGPANEIDQQVVGGGYNAGCVRLENFIAMVKFLYTEEVELGLENFVDIFYAAHYYRVAPLEKHCVKNIARTLRPNNLFRVLSELHRHDNFSPTLRNACLVASDWCIKHADFVGLKLPRDPLAVLGARPRSRTI